MSALPLILLLAVSQPDAVDDGAWPEGVRPPPLPSLLLILLLALLLLVLTLLLSYVSLSLSYPRHKEKLGDGKGIWPATTAAKQVEKVKEMGAPRAMLFPAKEDKEGRFRRWGRCFRRQPPAANPPLPARLVEVDLHLAIQAFNELYEQHRDRQKEQLLRISRQHQQKLQQQEEGEVQDQWAVTQSLLALKQRMVHFLLSAGPPQRLCSIPEGSCEGQSCPSSTASSASSTPKHLSPPCPGRGLQAQGSLPLCPLPAQCLEAAGAALQDNRAHRKSSTVVLQGRDLDAETVLQVSGDSPASNITRETLWAAVALLSQKGDIVGLPQVDCHQAEQLEMRMEHVGGGASRDAGVIDLV